MESAISVSCLLEGLPIWVNDDSSVWPTLRVARSVPLGRLEWIWSSRGASIRDTSTSARVLFNVFESAESLPEAYDNCCDWFRNPYVFIFVTTVNDLDQTKKSATWARIHQFVDHCREKYFEYLIVLAATESELSKNKRLVDKLRTEVNLVSRGRERVVSVPPAAIQEELRPITHLHHSPSHQDLLARLRECMRDAVESRIQSYEQEVTRTYLNRSSSSWSFMSFFCMKEGMAFIFVQLGRKDLAVKFYDELYVTMTERNERGAGKFCDLPAAEAAAGVTNPDAREYRRFLMEGVITEIDFRTYLFSRQSWLLLEERKFSEVAERGFKFVTSSARRCAEEALTGQQGISGVFRDIWVFATARALAAALAPAIPSPTEAAHALSTQLSSSRERHTARLIAGFHISALKAFVSLAHVVHPGCLAQGDQKMVPGSEDLAQEALITSNEKLRNALSSREKAELLHSEIANAAASLYEMGGRARGAAALDGDAGIVRLRNGSHLEAEKLLSAQCSRFTNDIGWDDLHRRQRLQLAHAEKALDRVQEYLVSCLAMLYMTRTSRPLKFSAGSDVGSEDEISRSAEHWITETMSVASRLPRVMKYKAEKLFEVRVIRNDAAWREGDSGCAFVRIKSDLPTTILADTVLVEFKCCSSSTNAHKSALHHSNLESPRQHLEDEITSPKGASSSQSQKSISNAEQTDLLILSSKERVQLRTGMNDIPVSVDEILHSGTYKVSIVAIFLGNLKLVQTPSKASPHPIVTTKGQEGSKSSMSPMPNVMYNDFAKGGVKFPLFFSSPRPASASLVVHDQVLYYAPNCVQLVRITISAGDQGIAKASRVTCSLLGPDATRMSSKCRFVQFIEVESQASETSLGEDMLRVIPLSGAEDFFDCGEVTLQEELGPHEFVRRTLAIQLSTPRIPSSSTFWKEGDETSCKLHLQMSCCEKNSGSTRTFTCETNAGLTFVIPFDVSAHIESTAPWAGDSVSTAVENNGSMSNAGTLLCSIRGRVLDQRKLTIINATLQCPAWLELRLDEPPPHTELLPATIGNACAFVCAFDLFGRDDHDVKRHQFNVKAGHTADPSFGKGTIRRLPRMADTNAMTGDNCGEWVANSVSDDSSSQSEQVIPLGGVGVDQSSISSSSSSMHVTGEEGDHSELKEEQVVVDLSTPGRGSSRTSLHSSSFAESPESIATLRVEFRVDGIEGTASIDRRISVEAFREERKMYQIERDIQREGESGKVMNLRFSVQMTGGQLSRFCKEGDSSELQYEVDADPAVWLVVGRRRGKVNVSGTESANEATRLIPLLCGQHRVPCVRLFSTDGRGVPLSQYQNVNEYMQVAVRPCRTILSACEREEQKHGVANDSTRKAGRGGMPVVIAADSFFGA